MVLVRTDRKRSPWQAIAAFVCFACALLAVLFGTLFTTGWLLNAEVHPLLHALGLLLLIVAIPILILGGHCLDLLDKAERKDERPRNY